MVMQTYKFLMAYKSHFSALPFSPLGRVLTNFFFFLRQSRSVLRCSQLTPWFMLLSLN